MNKLNPFELDFLESIQKALGVNSQREVFLKYKNFPFVLEPHGEEILVRSMGVMLWRYKDFNEMIYTFKLDEKAFVEQISEIDFD